MARLNLHLLGPPRIDRDGVAIKVDTRKAIALLAYIAITRESHSRDALVNLLWPEYDQARGRAALRRTLSALRKALAGDWLDAGRQNVGLNRGGGMWLDVDQFHGHLAQCLTHGHPASEVCPACLDPLTDAVALCRGDFLRGFSLRDSFNFDDWQFFQTDSLRRELAGALERLVQCHSARGEFERAIDYAKRWVALDRLDELAHCQLMRLYAWSGKRSAALRQYQECVRILESQLGISPLDSTTALFGAIQQGRAPPTPTSQQLRRLRERMEHHAPPAPEAPRDVLDEKKRIATVLLADISGSFRRRGDISPENQASLVNRFLGVVEDTLSEYGGQIYRCLGASVLAVFGTGQTHESDPELAIRAAIDIRREAAELGLGVTAAVTTGKVYLSAMGSEGRGAFTLIGAVLDLAVGLAGQAQVGQIVVGGSTYRLTRRAFQFTPLSLSIKGMAHPAVAYQVRRLLPQPRKARGIQGLRAELIGRNEELAKLKEALAEVLDERGHMVSLIGEAGVGKSRLVAELKQFALTPRDDTPRPLWLEGRSLELGMTASYSPFIDVFRGYFAWGAEDDDHKRRERILSSLEEMVERGDLPEHRVEEMAALLGNLLSVQGGDEWDKRLREDNPEQIRRQTFATVGDFLVALSKQQPLVLVFEDLHWADSLSLDLISLMMEGLRLGPLLLLCVYRPEREHKCRHLGIIASQKCRERYTELRLRELAHEQSRQLVGSLLSIDDLTPAVRDVILDRSQGNPFFIEEVVRSLIETGILYREAGFWRVCDELDSAVVPETVQRVVLTRVDHLDDDSKHILQIASVIGRVFQPRVLEHVAQREAGLAGALWELEERALIYQERAIPEVEYSFKHVLAQEAVYQSLLGGRRRAIHRQAAEAIEALYPSSLQEYCEQLAYHYDRSGSVQPAVDYLLKAGEKAKRSYANEEAIAHLSRGLELLETSPAGPEHDRQELDLQLALGVPLVHTRGHAAPEVERVYRRARELSERESDPSQRFQSLLGLRRFYLVRGDLRTAYALGEQLLTLAQSAQDPSCLSRAHMMQGEVLYWLGEPAQAREHCEQGIALYDPQQHRSHIFIYGNDTGVGCRMSGALALWQLGYPDQALRTAHEMLILAQKLSHPFTLVCALYHSAVVHQLRREVSAAQEGVEALLQISTDRGFALYSAWGATLRGWILAQQGREEEGIDWIHKSIAVWQATGGVLGLPQKLAFLAEAYGKAGKTQEALSLLDEALRLVDSNGERCWEAELYRLKAELLVKGEEEAQAEACFQHALAVARRQDTRSWELRTAMGLCGLWQKQGKVDDAWEMLAEIYGWFTEGFDTTDLREARALLEAPA